MTTRAFKTVVVCALGVVVVVGGGWYAFEILRENGMVGRTKSELRIIGQAAQKFALEHSDIELWNRMKTSNDFLEPFNPSLEAGRGIWKDAWNQPYLLERRDEPHEIVFTLYSDHPIRNGLLGIEFAVSRSDGMARVKHLWEGD